MFAPFPAIISVNSIVLGKLSTNNLLTNKTNV
ncbi:hypothetical protein FHW36_105217 [Chitinophaga polysaccharea]|uniref:Uncharacterized protein n=1 Tax=Chitinophaga polysaccharea TaxID=1293035 RepID=A0A561PNU4_9BACT|nr:hypothetical protein FHW36_105217 [Chitinophaga polysaccharea]